METIISKNLRDFRKIAIYFINLYSGIWIVDKFDLLEGFRYIEV